LLLKGLGKSNTANPVLLPPTTFANPLNGFGGRVLDDQQNPKSPAEHFIQRQNSVMRTDNLKEEKLL